MIWIEIVCDCCSCNPLGEWYRKGSVARLKQLEKQYGWKTIKGKIYCPDCQLKLKADKESKEEEDADSN